MTMRFSTFTVFIVSLLISAPVLSQLPGLAPSVTPVTTLTLSKSSNNIVLSWTTSPNGSYDYIVTRGIAHPEYRAEVIIATITISATTYTDTNALIRTRQSYNINEFYRVYAVPKNYKALGFNSIGKEYRHRIKNQSLNVATIVTNGNTIGVYPTSNIATMHLPLSMVNTNKYDLDIYNLPRTEGKFNVRLNPQEMHHATVMHTAYDGDIYADVPSADGAYYCEADILPRPSVSKDGNIVEIAWEQIDIPYEGSIKAIRVVRTFIGVGNGEPQVLIATVEPSATSAEDDITSVPQNYYVFYQLQLVYVDNTMSLLSASSDPVRR